VIQFIETKGWTLVERYPDDQKHKGAEGVHERREFLHLLAAAEEGGRLTWSSPVTPRG
jgi:hypothetical protein